jgi:hypothetical protein
MFTVITNVEQIEDNPFLVVLVFDADGYQVDACYRPYENVADAIIFISEVMDVFGQSNYKALTSNRELFARMITEPGIVVEIKHPDDTGETGRFIKRNEDILRGFYNVATKPLKPQLPRWRVWLFLWLEKITEKIRGADKYEI